MEKKQLFNNSLVGFYPEIFIPEFKLDINIDDHDIYEDFNVTKYITLDNNFIDIYNKIKEAELCSILLSITNNNSDNSDIILSGYKGTSNLFFRDTVIVKTTEKILISTFDIVSINTSSKTAYINFIRKVISQSDLDNTIVHLTTTINGLTNLNPGDFNETVTLTAEEYNALNEVPVGEVFILVNDVDATTFLIFKSGNTSFRANRDYIDHSLTNRLLISFLIDLGENNQATFKGNVTRLMDFNNYLAKDNTTEYTPTNDYNPVTKKYVDDSVRKVYRINFSSISVPGKSIINGNGDPSQYNFTLTSKELEEFNKISNRERVMINIDVDRNGIADTYVYAYLDGLSNDIQTVKVDRLYCSSNRVIFTGCFNVDRTTGAGYWINLIKLNAYTVITESEYAALGTTPNTDNVLYFITPD